jgi:hypothetical protein
VIGAITIDIVSFERSFLLKLRLLITILNSVSDAQPEFASSLTRPLEAIDSAHGEFIATIESTVRAHSASWVSDFVNELTYVADILDAHRAYATQLLHVKNFIYGFSVDCSRDILIQLDGELLIHQFTLLFQ